MEEYQRYFVEGLKQKCDNKIYAIVVAENEDAAIKGVRDSGIYPLVVSRLITKAFREDLPKDFKGCLVTKLIEIKE